jgi:hypothetical protein
MALATFGHWFTLMLNSKETQISSSLPSVGLCGFVIVNPAYSAATTVYTTIFDFVLLKLAIFGLWRSSSLSLFTIIRTQDIILYLIVLLASVVPSIFSWLNFNYIMNVFFAWPATCVMYDSSPLTHSLIHTSAQDDSIKLCGDSCIHHASHNPPNTREGSVRYYPYDGGEAERANRAFE